MNSPSADVKDILISADSSDVSILWDFGTTLFVSTEPDTPDRCLTIIDTGGFDPDVSSVYERPTIQIRSRDQANQFLRAYAAIREVIDYLHAERHTINSTVYTFYQQGDVFNLGRDEDNRVLLTANMRIQRTPS